MKNYTTENKLIIFGNNKSYNEECEGLFILGNNDDRDLDGTLIIFRAGKVNQALGVFFKGHNAIRIKKLKQNVLFFDLSDNLLLELKLDRIGGFENFRDYLAIKWRKKNHSDWNGQLMYDFQNHEIKGCSGYGLMGAIAVPFENEAKNGTIVPQIFSDILFRKYA